MIKTVRFDTPTEWIRPPEDKEYPIAMFAVTNFSLNKGREQGYGITLWFLDKCGQEGVYEVNVISDMHSIAADIISSLRIESNAYTIDETINGTPVAGKFEDYLAGVEVPFTLTTWSDFDACDTP